MGSKKSDKNIISFYSKPSQKIYKFNDYKNDLNAYIVIDTLYNGNSCGGLRISDDLTLEEIKLLAKKMTLKYSFLKINTGGAKAGIKLPSDCSSKQRTKILETFGKKASNILRKKLYVPWTDINTNTDDIYLIMKSAG